MKKKSSGKKKSKSGKAKEPETGLVASSQGSGLERKTLCPECERAIILTEQDLEIMETPLGEILECNTCFSELEIVQIDPSFKVKIIEEEK